MGFPKFSINLEAVPGQDCIVMSNGGLITVYCLEDVPFKADNDKLVFYGDDHGSYFAFETEYSPEIVDEISAAITWYAKNKLDYPQMELMIEDPRPKVN